MNYYNEFNPKVAAWLRELIARGHIAPGVVDERSIEDITPQDLDGFTQCHLFAGIGGWPLALQLAGWPDSKPVWTGSCPCQPFSVAGKGEGAADERHLWPAFKWLVAQCQPPVVFGEQVASQAGREWLAGVRLDLEDVGYEVGAADLCAASVKAKHIRQRLWWFANSKRNVQSWEESCSGEDGRMGGLIESVSWDRDWQSALSSFRILGDGLPRSVAACDAARNAIVPQVAAEFIRASIEAVSGRRAA